MKTSIIFLLLITISSCNLFENKNKLLTNKNWTLVLKDFNNKTERFDIEDKKLTLLFKNNNTVDVSENKEDLIYKLNWKWKTEKKERIILFDKIISHEYKILDLDKNKLNWYEVDENNKMKIEMFK